ncbi:uncharacterized protein METZ01_LOCUS463408, partial [marine metagenome]
GLNSEARKQILIWDTCLMMAQNLTDYVIASTLRHFALLQKMTWKKKGIAFTRIYFKI